MKVKYAGTQQHPIATTKPVALEIRVTISRKTIMARIKALGFTFIFFSINEKSEFESIF